MGCSYKPEIEDSTSMVSFTNKNKLTRSVSSKIGSIQQRSDITDANKEATRAENEELTKYLYSIGKQKSGLHEKFYTNTPPKEFLNLQHPDLNEGQRIFLSNLSQIYSVSPLKQFKQSQYLSLLDQQKDFG